MLERRQAFAQAGLVGRIDPGKHHAGANCDVLVTDSILQFWIGSELCKTVTRTSTGEVRKKRASIRKNEH